MIVIRILLAIMVSSLAASSSSAQDDITAIHVIQGDGSTSQLIGKTVAVEAIVIGDFRGENQLNGFYLQEEDSDADGYEGTSEGIFAYDPGKLGDKKGVSSGDLVRATGKVCEINGMTEINLSAITKMQGVGVSNRITAEPITLPFEDTKLLERYEGMLVELPQEFIITDNEDFDAYGQITISPNARLPNPTNVAKPGASAIAIETSNERSQIILDDGSNQANPKLDSNSIPRCGNSVLGIRGIIIFDFGEYRIHPVNMQKIFPSNPRPEKPESVGGTVKVASFNVENYINGDGTGGGFLKDRGAKSKGEFKRQRIKIIDAITDMDADVIGLMEIENDGYEKLSAISDLVSGLNTSENKHEGVNYSFVDRELQKLGTDDISVEIIYNSLKVRPIGKAATIATGAFSGNNRQPLAQTFEEISAGERFTVVVNHLKSKIKSEGKKDEGTENMDIGDGQSFWNGVRTDAAKELTAWILNDPTKSGDPDFLVIGDMNSYAYEDPITAFRNAGYKRHNSSFCRPKRLHIWLPRSVGIH